MEWSLKQLLLLSLLTMSFDTGVSQVCPFGWIERKESDACYLISADSTRYKFPDAVSKCQSYQAEPLIITTADEKTWVVQQLQKVTAAFPSAKIWWLGLQFESNNYQWLDGTAADNSLVPWQNGLPGSSQGPCVAIKDQQAFNTSCINWNNLLCKRPKSLPLSCDVDNQWMFINGSCFKTFIDKRTWHDAKGLCQMENANLATLTTLMEHSDIWDKARNTNPPSAIWTGLTVQRQSGQLQLSWLDGTALSASETFWKDGQLGQPRNGTSLIVDGTVPRRLKSWAMESNTAQHGYVCQRPQGVCEDGWLTHQNECFKIFDMNVAWTYASFVCHTIGGQLINLASPSDQTFIQRYLPEIKASGHASFWIGLTDTRADNGTYTWLDGTKVGNSSHWLQGVAPNDTVGQRDCGYIYTNDASGRWRMTSDCLQQRTFVCSIPVNTPVQPLPPSTTPSGQCETGWQYSGGQCYYFADRVMTWQNASQNCVSLGGRLAIIKTQDDQSFINSRILNGDYWFGMTLTTPQNQWTWVDGSQLTAFFNWGAGEPNQEGVERCAMAWGTRGEDKLGQWNDGPCENKRRYICQKHPSTNVQATTVPTTTRQVVYSEKCGNNWEERPNTDYCYQFHSETQRYADALRTCQRYNGSLVSITDHAEQNYLAGRAMAMSVSLVWIGASDSSVEGGWSWEDGSPFAYLNWNPGQPDSVSDADDCAGMVIKTSRWSDFHCNLRFGFICKKMADTYTTTPRPNTTPLPAGMYWSCPTGYIGYHYQCYATHTTSKRWSDAQQTCRTDGAELASLSNQQENDFLFSILPAETCDNVHVRDEECEQWAEQGECERNPAWMSQNCRDACKQCHQICLNKHNHEQCQGWASMGECSNNPNWMLRNCARSCEVCGGDSTTGTGTWLGLNERQIKGSFTWSDMTPVTFTNWHTTMPLRFPASSCALMTKVDGGTWVNAPCDGFAKYVCKKPISVSAATSMSPFKIGCPINAMGLQSYCYQVVATVTSWQKAETFCARSHGHLATINSVAILSFVMAELDTTAADHYWIGLSDAASPGTYTWSSGQPVLYAAWNANHTGNERNSCAGMQTKVPIGLWQSLDCGANRPFVCEYPRRGFTTPTTSTVAVTTAPIACPRGWTGFEQNCYRAFKDSATQKSWSDARDFCRSYGADLASIHNNTLNDFFRDTLIGHTYGNSGNYWIGLTDADTEGTYVWSDGTPMQYAKWSRGEPNNAGGNEDCGEYNKFTDAWNDNSCYINNPFICSIPRGKPLVTTLLPPTTTPVPRCDGTDWLAYNGNCYYISPQFGHDATKTWFEARRFCQTSGADLASISSENVNTFLVRYLSRLGSNQQQFWIDSTSSVDVPSNGSPVVYTSWAESEPNDGYGEESCTDLFSLSGKWNDDNCNDEFHFICKRSNSTSGSIPPVPTPLIHGGCPPGFSGVGNKCYKVAGLADSTASNFSQAMQACRALGSYNPVDLASITNHQQQAFVMTLLEGANSSVYIGLNDRHVNNHFVWLNNEEVAVTYWAPNQPSQRQITYGTAKEDCVAMLVDENKFGRWDDVYCGSKRGYVCQTAKDGRYSLTSPGNGGCKDGFLHYRDSCYGVYKMPKNWTNAENTCITDGGHLVSLRDIHELAKASVFIYQAVIIQSVWIGMSYQEATGEYLWLDGWPVAITQWDQGEPDLQTRGSCVTMQSGVWNDTSCSETHPFVCKISSATPPPTTPQPPGYCGDPSWAPNGDFCYYAKPQDSKSWPQANYICRSLGMNLVSLHDDNELAFIKSLTTLAVTTPRYGQLRPVRIWLGLRRNLEGGFRWSDNSAMDYFQWNTGEPNNMNHEEECVELLIDSGKWNDIACVGGSGSKRGYICKAPKIMPSTSTTTTTTTSSPSTSVKQTPRPFTRTPRPFTRGPPIGPYVTASPPGQVTAQGTGKTARSTGTNKSNNTLSGGQIAGIVIGLIALIVIVGVGVYIFRRRRQYSAGLVESASGFDNALYNKSSDAEQVSLSSNGSTNVVNGSNRLNVITLNHADAAEDC